MKNHYFRLVIYGLLSLVFILLIQSILGIFDRPKFSILYSVNLVINYSILSIFGILFLNKIEFYLDSNFRFDYYGLYVILYSFFVIILAGIIQKFLFLQNNVGFDNFSKLGFKHFIIFLYLIFFSIFYVKFRAKLLKFQWL